MENTAQTPVSQKHLAYIAIWATVVIFGLLAVALWLLDFSRPPRELGIRMLEILVQTVAVTVAGGLLVQAYLKWHSRELAINDFRRALLDGLISAYMEVKRIRRLLRASADHAQDGTEGNPWTQLPIAGYDKCLTELGVTEISLQVLCRRVEIFASVFPDATSLVGNLKGMHDYLEDVVREFERHKSFTRGQSDSLQISELSALSGFMLREERSSFSRFAKPYHEVLKALQGGAISVSL